MAYEIKKHGQVLYIRFFETLTSTDFAELFNEMKKFETDDQEPAHRITDLSGVTAFDLKDNAMRPIARERGEQKLCARVKSAIIASRPLELTIAQLLQSLNSNPDIAISIFPSQAEAEAWVQESGLPA